MVPLLGRGPRGELEKLPVRFPTRVPSAIGLPALEGNTAEGFVLKPDAKSRFHERYVTKWKIPEMDDARFDESMPWQPDTRLTLDELESTCDRLVNPARIASARSKVGTDPAHVRDEVALDVLVDIEAAFPRALASLTSDQIERLRARVADRVAVSLSLPT